MKYIGLDIEAKNLKPKGGTIWMISITRMVGKKPVSELFEDCNGIKKLPQRVLDELADPNVCKIIHSSGYDAPYLQLVLNFKAFGCYIVNIWDSENLEVVIQGQRVSTQKKNLQPDDPEEIMMLAYSSRLEYVLPRYGFPRPDKETRSEFIDRPLGKPFSKKPKDYAINDTRYLPAIQKVQEAVLKRDGLYELALLENKCSEKIAAMRIVGIGLDKKLWAKIANANQKEFDKRLSKLPEAIKNPNQHEKVKQYFMNKGVKLDSYKEIDQVFMATRNKTLGDFIFAKELNKSITTYGMSWFEKGFIDSDDRVRCDVIQSINTGRMSMSNPPLQQMPGDGKSDVVHLETMEILYAGEPRLKPQHRSAFIPRPGYEFVIGDFSGQEIGIMAAASGERLWIEAMLRGEDVHGLTASIVDPSAWQNGRVRGCTFPKKCKCPLHIVTRKPAKINNFMLAYGGGPQKLAFATGMDNLAARVYCAKHKRAIPNLNRYLDRLGREALDTGVSYSADPYRRRRVLTGEEGWQIRNQGMNTPIQSAGANMLKLAMISVPNEFPIVLVIHDEIILEVKKAKAHSAMRMLKQVMEKSADYVTGIKGLIKVEPRIAGNIMKD